MTEASVTPPSEPSPSEQDQSLITSTPTPEPSQEAAPPAVLTVDDVKAPEGFDVDESVRDSFLGIMNNQELTPAARAQALVDLQAQIVKSTVEGLSGEVVKQRQEWREAAEKDPEFGGDKLSASLSGIGGLIDEYGDEGLREAFSATGAGDNPHMFRFLARIAAALGEGRPTPGMPASGGITASDLYPSMKKG